MMDNILQTQMDFSKEQAQTSATTNKLNALNERMNGVDRDEAMKAAQDFEKLFISQMFTHMYSGIKTDGYFGGGHQEEMFRSYMIDEFADISAQTGGIGLSDAIQKQIIQMQEQMNEQ